MESGNVVEDVSKVAIRSTSDQPLQYLLLIGICSVQYILRDRVERHPGPRLAVAHVDLHEAKQVGGRFLVRLVPVCAHHGGGDGGRCPGEHVAN